MKKSIFTKIFAVAALLLVVTSCAKYDEGSNFSIFTAKARLVNSWTLESATYTSGSTTTSVTASGTLTVNKDGSYSTVITITYPFIGNVTTNETGTWEFNGDKDKVITTDSNGNVTTYDIVKLKNKEMSLTYTNSNNGDVTRYNYKS